MYQPKRKENEFLRGKILGGTTSSAADVDVPEEIRIQVSGKGDKFEALDNWLQKRQFAATSGKAAAREGLESAKSDIDLWFQNKLQNRLSPAAALSGNGTAVLKWTGEEFILDKAFILLYDSSPAFRLSVNTFVDLGRDISKLSFFNPNNKTLIEMFVNYAKHGVSLGVFHAEEVFMKNIRSIMVKYAGNIPDEVLRDIFLKAKDASAKGEDVLADLSQEELEMLTDYLIAHPYSKYSIDETLDIIRKGGIYNEETGFFRAKKKIDIPSVSKEVDFSKDTNKYWTDEMEILRVERQGLREQAKEIAKSGNMDSDAYKAVMKQVIDKSESLGEAAADSYVRQKYPLDAKYEQPIFPTAEYNITAKHGIFDLVYKLEDGKILIVEAKGGSSGLGSRVIKSQGDIAGQVAEQGSRAYLLEIINVMKVRGGKYLELAEEIEDALDKTNVMYIMVKQELNPVTGELKPIIVEEFNIDK